MWCTKLTMVHFEYVCYTSIRICLCGFHKLDASWYPINDIKTPMSNPVDHMATLLELSTVVQTVLYRTLQSSSATDTEQSSHQQSNVVILHVQNSRECCEHVWRSVAKCQQRHTVNFELRALQNITHHYDNDDNNDDDNNTQMYSMHSTFKQNKYEASKPITIISITCCASKT